MSRAALRVVRSAPARPSLIVDMTDPTRRTSSPWTLDELQDLARGPIPIDITIGAFIAAWATSEDYLLQSEGREITLRPKSGSTPTAALEHAIASSANELVGIIGFGVPLLFNERRIAFAASWPLTWVRS